MYTPAAFRVDDPDWIHAFVEANPFGLLVSTEPLVASHLPFHLLRPEGGRPARLVCHLARANPQWQALASGNAKVLCVFRGSHAYVSPSWYGAQPAVPTWNYDAVHAEGIARLVEDRAEIEAQMRATAAAYEPSPGFAMDAMPPDYARRMFAQLVGLSIEVTSWTAKRKQSQNRPAGDRAAVAAALEAGGEHEAAAAIREAGG